MGSPRHLVSALYQKSEKQCRKSLTELCSLPEKQWETNELMPTLLHVISVTGSVQE